MGWLLVGFSFWLGNALGDRICASRISEAALPALHTKAVVYLAKNGDKLLNHQEPLYFVFGDLVLLGGLLWQLLPEFDQIVQKILKFNFGISVPHRKLARYHCRFPLPYPPLGL